MPCRAIRLVTYSATGSGRRSLPSAVLIAISHALAAESSNSLSVSVRMPRVRADRR